MCAAFNSRYHVAGWTAFWPCKADRQQGVDGCKSSVQNMLHGGNVATLFTIMICLTVESLGMDFDKIKFAGFVLVKWSNSKFDLWLLWMVARKFDGRYSSAGLQSTCYSLPYCHHQSYHVYDCCMRFSVVPVNTGGMLPLADQDLPDACGQYCPLGAGQPAMP